MSFPFVIDNLSRRLADALSELLEQGVDRPLDIATAYFSISGYRQGGSSRRRREDSTHNKKGWGKHLRKAFA